MGCDNIVKVTDSTVQKDAHIPFNNILWTCPINRQKILDDLIAKKATVTLLQTKGGLLKNSSTTCKVKNGGEYNLTCAGFLGFLGDSTVNLEPYSGLKVTSIGPKAGGRKRKTRKSSRRTTRTRRSRY